MHDFRIGRTTAVALSALLGAAAVFLADDADAKNLNVSANVLSSCTITTDVSLTFGDVNPQNGVPAGTVLAHIPVDCTGNATVDVTLDGGQNIDGQRRFMKNGSSVALEYVLRNGGSDWLPGESRQTNVVSGVTSVVTVDGIIPMQPSVGAGSFTDKVLITVSTVQQ